MGRAGAAEANALVNGVPMKTGAWDPDEDEKLARYQREFGNKWSVVAQYIPGRTGQQCAQRWRHKVNPNIKKEKWSVEEDALLTQLVAEHGNRWAEIARHIEGRTDQQCMGRWTRHLDPNISRDTWRPDEDALLVRLFTEHGTQWSRISKLVAGRTAQQCRARFFQIRAVDGVVPEVESPAAEGAGRGGAGGRRSGGRSGGSRRVPRLAVEDEDAEFDEEFESLGNYLPRSSRRQIVRRPRDAPEGPGSGASTPGPGADGGAKRRRVGSAGAALASPAAASGRRASRGRGPRTVGGGAELGSDAERGGAGHAGLRGLGAAVEEDPVLAAAALLKDGVPVTYAGGRGGAAPQWARLPPLQPLSPNRLDRARPVPSKAERAAAARAALSGALGPPSVSPSLAGALARALTAGAGGASGRGRGPEVAEGRLIEALLGSPTRAVGGFPPSTPSALGLWGAAQGDTPPSRIGAGRLSPLPGVVAAALPSHATDGAAPASPRNHATPAAGVRTRSRRDGRAPAEEASRPGTAPPSALALALPPRHAGPALFSPWRLLPSEEFASPAAAGAADALSLPPSAGGALRPAATPICAALASPGALGLDTPDLSVPQPGGRVGGGWRGAEEGDGEVEVKQEGREVGVGQDVHEGRGMEPAGAEGRASEKRGGRRRVGRGRKSGGGSASSPWPGGAAGPSEPFSTAPGVQATAGEGAGRTRRRK